MKLTRATLLLSFTWLAWTANVAGVQEPVTTAAVTGRVLDSNGQLLRGVRVTPYRRGFDDIGRPTLLPVTPPNPITSNDLGEFRIYGLPPGAYAFLLKPLRPNLPVYYPGQPQAEFIQLGAGTDERLRDVVVPAPAVGDGNLRVQITNQTGQGGSILVEVRRWETSEVIAAQNIIVFTTQIADLGKLPAGSYDVELSSRALPSPPTNAYSFYLSHRERIELAGDKLLEVTLQPGPALRLTAALVADTATTAVSGLHLTFVSDVALRTIPFELTTGPDGGVSLKNAPPGSYRVKAASGIPAGACLRELRQEGRNVLREGLSIGGGDIVLEAVLSPPQGLVRGSVADAAGRSLKNAVVALVPADLEMTELFAATTTDSAGIFNLSCIAPGQYQAYAWPGLDGPAYRNVAFMRAYSGVGIPVAVELNGSVSLDLVALPSPAVP